MKKQILLAGMLAVFLGGPSVSLAQGKSVKAGLSEYLGGPLQRWRANIKAKHASPEAQAKAMGLDKAIVAEGASLNANGLREALTGQNSAKNLETFSTIQGAHNFAENIIKKSGPNAEAQAIIDRSKVQIRVLADGVFTGQTTAAQKAGSRLLKETEFAEVDAVVRQIESRPEILLQMEDAGAAKKWTDTLSKRTELLASGKFTAEESLIQAIMDVHGVTKEKAMEIMRRMKDCIA